MWVFIGTMGLLLVPKLLGMLTVLVRRDLRRGCGGVPWPDVSLLLETLIAGLLAPVVMLTQIDRRRRDPAGAGFGMERATPR